MRVSFLVCLLVCAAASGSFAQTAGGGSIRGYVKDEQEAVLRGVVLTATSPEASTPMVATTDEAGYYRLVNLPAGSYTVRAELDGFTTWVRENVEVRAGLNLSFPIVMKIGNRNESIQVTAETPLIESRSATQAVNVSGDLQRDVPLSGRKHWADGLLVVPSVVAEETNNNTRYFFVHGAEQNSNIFQLDGADMAASLSGAPQYIALSTEAIQDVSVKSGSTDASTPLGLGAAMNVTTKEGTNRVRGAVTVISRARGWNSNNVPNGTTAAISFVQPDVGVGGPIVRDHAWFFGAYRRLDVTTGVSRTPAQIANLQSLVPGFTPYDAKNTGNLYFLKSTIAMARATTHRLSASFQRDPNSSTNASPDSETPGEVIFGGNGGTARLQSVWSASVLTDLSISYNSRGSLLRAVGTDRPQSVAYQSTALSGGRLVGVGRLGAYGASSTQSVGIPGEKLTISADARKFARGASGSHELQAGVFLQPLLAQQITLDYVNGGAALEERVRVDPLDPSKGTRVFHTVTYDNAHQPNTDLRGSDVGFYGQDSWNPTKSLTVSAGVRVDVIRRTDRLFNVETQRSRDIGPRLGATYAFTEDGSSVARASWARVHETPTQNWISPGLSAAGFSDRYDLNGDGSLETTFVTLGNTNLNPTLFIDADYHQPYGDLWNLGLSHQFPGRLTVDVGVTDRALKQGTAYLETNAIYDGVVFKGYRNVNIPQGIFEVTNNSWNWQTLRELEIAITKQTDRVQLIGTYSRQWRHIGGTWQPNDPASFIQPAAFADDKGIGRLSDSTGGLNQNGLSGSALAEYIGPAAQWRDHMARLAANVRVPGDVTFAVNATFQTGPWSGPVVTRIAAPDPAFGPPTVTLSNGRVVANPLATTFRFVGATRSEGQFTMPDYFTLNLRAGHTIAIALARVNVGVEAFNVTNRGEPQGLLTSGNQVGSVNYRLGGSIQLPRSFQLTVRTTF
jgi:hypothetical protein